MQGQPPIQGQPPMQGQPRGGPQMQDQPPMQGQPPTQGQPRAPSGGVNPNNFPWQPPPQGQPPIQGQPRGPGGQMQGTPQIQGQQFIRLPPGVSLQQFQGRVSFLLVVALWKDCRDIPTDQG